LRALAVNEEGPEDARTYQSAQTSAAPCSTRDYSARSTSTGSTAVARRAGSRHAAALTMGMLPALPNVLRRLAAGLGRAATGRSKGAPLPVRPSLRRVVRS
jgi:hypothetical protein